MAWASVIVRNANVPTKCTFGIYFEILIFFFGLRLKFNIMANGKFSKCYYPYTYDSYSTNFFLNVSCESPQKLGFWNFKFNIFFKKTKIEVFVSMGPYGSENSIISSYSYMILFHLKFLNLFNDIPHKSYLLGTWNFKLIVLEKDWNLTLWAMGKREMKIALKWLIVQRNRAICFFYYSGVLVDHNWVPLTF